jgi:hypothetical protein
MHLFAITRDKINRLEFGRTGMRSSAYKILLTGLYFR